tara:strand:- start:69 stop:233 length:165 start_codon:yes stop_codon:yes gene_type:complete
MDSTESIQSNTCEIIQIDQLFINEIKELKQKYLNSKQKIFQEIISEINEIKLCK